MHYENTTSIAGYAGSAPEILVAKYGGKLYAKFSVCVSEYWPNSRNVRRKTWFNCIAFGNLVEYIREKMKQGSFVEVTGSMEQYRYVDQEGNKRSTMKLKVSDITVWNKQMKQVVRDQERKQETSYRKLNQEDFTPEFGQMLPGPRFFQSEIDTENEYMEA